MQNNYGHVECRPISDRLHVCLCLAVVSSLSISNLFATVTHPFNY